MELTARLTELETHIRTADQQIAEIRTRLEQAMQERLLLMGAMLEVRRMLAPEPQSCSGNVTAEEIEMVSPGGTD